VVIVVLGAPHAPGHVALLPANACVAEDLVLVAATYVGVRADSVLSDHRKIT